MKCIFDDCFDEMSFLIYVFIEVVVILMGGWFVFGNELF